MQFNPDISLIAAWLVVAFLPMSVRSQSSLAIDSQSWGSSSRKPQYQRTAADDLSREVRRLTAITAPGQHQPDSSPSVTLKDQATWSTGFHPPGMAGWIEAQAIYHDELVIAGFFKFSGSVQSNNIVGWNGSTWSLLASGTNQHVHALTQYGENLVAGGEFTEASGVPAASVASWDGSRWNSLGIGVDGIVYTLAVFDGSLIAGGDFDFAGGISTSHIARWDGTRWGALRDDSTGVHGVNGRVSALTIFHGELIVAGWFDKAGGVACNGVARWNGSVWQPLGTGVNTKQVASLCVYDDELIVGGQFGYAGGVPVSGIARWDGTSWHSLGSGVGGITQPLVRSLTSFSGALVVGGIFQTAGDSVVNSVARWDGLSWHPLGGGVHFNPWDPPLAEVRTLATYHEQLYAGGFFFIAGDVRANDIACWDGQMWTPLDSGLGVAGAIRSLAPSGSDLIAGGTFIHAGSRPANRIARLTQGHWEPLGEGMDDDVNAVLLHHGAVIAGGEFLHAGGAAAYHVASWDGTRWNSLGDGLDGIVRALCVYRDTVVAGGDFTGSGSSMLNGIARWDGVRWQPLGGGMSAPVRCLHVFRDTLIAGGDFEIADYAPARHLAYWTGASWKELGGGTDRTVIGLGSYDGKLAVGGTFWTVGAVPASRVALWDGEWHALGEGLDMAAWCFIEYQSSLYVGGYFSQADGLMAMNVARWDGFQWHTLGEGGLDGDGVSAEVQTFAEFDGALYLGGYFGMAGNIRSYGIARWNGTTGVSIEDFRGQCEAGAIRLQWRVSDVESCREVIVERSIRREGAYETLVRIPSAGHGTMEYLDHSIAGAPSWWYRLRVSSEGAGHMISEPLLVTVSEIAGPSAIDGVDQQTDGKVVIRYHIAGSGEVPIALRVFDVRGRLVRTLEGGSKPPGAYVMVWTAGGVTRGIYFVDLTTKGRAATRKFVLQRP